MADQTKKRVPPIRFKGFSDEWDEKAIGEVLTEIKRPIKLVDNELYELVTVRRRNGGVVSRGHLHGKDILVKNYAQLRAGDFIISKRQVVHGATGLVPHHLDQAIVSNEYMVAVGNETISSEFLTIISTLPDMYRKFFLSSYGVDIEKLFFDTADWKKRNVVLPKLPEQNEICSYSSEIDKMIGLHQRKHEKLVTLKKAMLKKMFPQNGATTPEIRFKGFSKPWAEATLGEICEPFEYGLNAPATIYDGENKYLRITDIDDRHEFNHADLTSPNTDLKNAEKYLLRNGDILFARTGASVGKTYLYKETDGRVFFAGFLIRARIKESKSSNFIFQNTLTNKYAEFVRLTSQRSGQPGINANEYSCYRFHLPEIDEQQKIGTYLRQMDELIAQHGTQVEKLKQIKAACLEKMFV